jgi:hypothetical protein
MFNDRILAADIDYAVRMVREGYATPQLAAQACGIPLQTLQAHLTGIATVARDVPASSDLKGSVSQSVHQPDSAARASAEDAARADAQAAPDEVESTDYFVFYREDGCWVWKRVDDAGHIVKACDQQFKFYLDCVADARPHGFNGRPLFIFAASDIASLNAPDRDR